MSTYYYWYAITPDLPFPLNGDQSSDSLTLERIGYWNLSAIVSKIADSHRDPSPQSVAEHHRIVARLLNASNYRVLPLRFGTILTPDRILSLLESRHDEWTRLLQDIEGSVEMSLKVLWVPPTFDVPPRPLQSAYFTQRLQAMQQQKTLGIASREKIAAIETRLEGLYLKRLMATPRHPDLLIEANYLMPEPRAQAFKQAVRTLMEEMSDYRWLCTGPWPPYHFVS